MNAVGPLSGFAADSGDVTAASTAQSDDSQQESAPSQSLSAGSEAEVRSVVHDEYSVEELPPPPPPEPDPPEQEAAPEWASAAPPPDPGTAKAYARSRLADMGMGDDQFSCLVSLWDRESGWNVHAHNGGSGAYGIPQAMPGSKMASAGPDWQNNAHTQVDWGLGYIQGRYGTPCGAWGQSQAAGWY